jgi:hypothetical protein
VKREISYSLILINPKILKIETKFKRNFIIICHGRAAGCPESLFIVFLIQHWLSLISAICEGATGLSNPINSVQDLKISLDSSTTEHTSQRKSDNTSG